MSKLAEVLIPWCVALLALVYVALQARPEVDSGPYRLGWLGQVPVSADGRVKPLDTVARNGLMIISGRQTLKIDGNRQPAIRWLADVLARPEQADQYPLFRIDHPQVLSLMGLSHDDGKRFSYDTLKQHQQVIAAKARAARDVVRRNRNGYQRKLLELVSHLTLYDALRARARPQWIPPLAPGEDWRSYQQVWVESAHAETPHPALVSIDSILGAYHHQQSEAFNGWLSNYLTNLERVLPGQMRWTDYEVFFNRFEPFFQAMVFYFIAFLLGCVSFLLRCGASGVDGRGLHWSRGLGRAAVGLLGLTLTLHTFGIVSRTVLQGYAPVTNLYSSAVFIGWVGVASMLVIEWFFRLGLGAMVASVIGVATSIIAHNLAGDGDTMQMMQAVLDSNFWLSTHVLAVTTGYAATFLAGLVAILFIFLGVFTRVLDRDWRQAMGKMVYGIVCFAALFSFVGTVLGGIWADQSWGRFWGWDPKENGAVLIVLMTVLILHARWGGMIRERGMMVLAVGGNIVTSWSWFGTNMLGVGLHSYGFMDSAVFWLLLFVTSQAMIMGIGMLPLSAWRSYHQPNQMHASGQAST